jgi:hypothetical protein
MLISWCSLFSPVPPCCIALCTSVGLSLHAPPSRHDDDLRLIARLPAVHSIDMVFSPIGADFWSRLMSLPVVQSNVHTLEGRMHMRYGDLTIIRGLKQLHTLNVSQGYANRQNAELLACLAECHALTALSYDHCGDSDNANRQLGHIAACPRLKSLTLEDAMSVKHRRDARPSPTSSTVGTE